MIYLGNFFHVTNQQSDTEADRRYGEFNLVVEAETKEEAIEHFRERILDFREATDFFAGDSTIFFIQLLEFESFPSAKAMMLNFKSIAGDPIMPYIGCSVPSQEGDFCRIFDWSNNTPSIDGKDEKLFLEFKGEA